MVRSSRHQRFDGRGRRGAVLVEFALVSLVLYLLVAAGLEFGRATFSAQVIQDAARLGARELALTPLPAAMTLDDALARAEVRSRIYDPERLVIDLDTDVAAGQTLDEFFGALPLVNQALRPAMIYEEVEIGGATRRLLRYPGALLGDPSAPSGLTVGIPLVTSRSASGEETIEWLAAVEEIRNDRTDPTTGPFSMDASGPAVRHGLVALRINYPYQAASLGGYRASPAGPLEPNGTNPNVADDGAVTETNAPAAGSVIGSLTSSPGAYSGPFGLGTQLAVGQRVRPFRRLLTAQAIFRREAFE